MTKPKIFISGDSWGVGVWSPELTHGGLGQFFSELGYRVINSSLGGASNLESIDRLKYSLKNNYSLGDLVFWIKSDPARTLRYNKDIINAIKNAGDYRTLIKNMSNESYDILNSLAAEFKTTIHMIGGLCTLGTSHIKELSNLNALVPSWTDLLVGHLKDYPQFKTEYCCIDVPGWVIGQLKDAINNLELSKRLIDEWYDLSLNEMVFREDAFRLESDGVHPNKESHRKIFDFIVKELELS